MRKIAASVVLLLGATSFALAGTGGSGSYSGPEIDGSYVAGTCVLIGGATLIIRSRLRRKQ